MHTSGSGINDTLNENCWVCLFVWAVYMCTWCWKHEYFHEEFFRLFSNHVCRAVNLSSFCGGHKSHNEITSRGIRLLTHFLVLLSTAIEQNSRCRVMIGYKRWIKDRNQYY